MVIGSASYGGDRPTRDVGLAFVAVVAAAAVGAAVASAPDMAIAAAGILVLGAAIVAAQSQPVAQVFVGVLVIMCATVDLPNQLPTMAGVSGQALLTGLYVVLAALVVLGTPERTVGRDTFGFRALLLFVVWACISLTWTTPSLAAAQNTLAFVALPMAIFAGYWTGRLATRPCRFADRLLTLVTVISGVLYTASLVRSGIGGGGVVGSRSFGLFAIVTCSWMAAGVRYKGRWARVLLLVTVALVVMSLSRTALAAVLLLTPIAWMDVRRIGGWLRPALTAIAVLAIGVGLVAFVPSLHDRFFTGDVQSVDAGPKINVTGRFQLWRATWNSYVSSPVIGHGAGSADVLITREFGNGPGHPHNDYLRVLHDEGAIGFALLVAAILALVRGRWMEWQYGSGRDRSEKRLHAAALLCLVGIALAMVTDNVLTYIFVMGPAGAIVGLSSGVAARGTRRAGKGSI